MMHYVRLDDDVWISAYTLLQYTAEEAPRTIIRPVLGYLLLSRDRDEDTETWVNSFLNKHKELLPELDLVNTKITRWSDNNEKLTTSSEAWEEELNDIIETYSKSALGMSDARRIFNRRLKKMKLKQLL